MDSDVTTGTESDTSDIDPGKWPGYLSGNRSSEYSEDSDDYQGYYDDGRRIPGVYDTNIDNVEESFYDPYPVQKGQKRTHEDENDIKIRHALAQLNAPVSNNNLGRPLYAIHETASLVSESSGSVGDKSDSNPGTPVHRPVYGRYQKLSNQNDQFSSSSNQDPEDSDSESLEILILHRLPGENLGMILGIEGGKDNTGKVSSVLVKSVTLGGAAYRATGSNKGVCVSDEILKVNGTDLRTLSHDECISVFKDMPLRVLLGVRRGQKNLPPVEISPNEEEKIDRKFDFQHSIHASSNDRRNYSDSEDEKMSGFAVYKVTIEKEPYETLGLSIVPSYGSTKEFYQIKRILPSGAAAQSGQLQVGDRLITCNSHSLKRLTQSHCLNILKSSSAKGDLDLEVIRPVHDGASMEISVTLNNNNTQIPGFENTQLSRFENSSSEALAFDPSQYSLKSQSYDRGRVDVVVTSESEDYLTLSEDEYSRAGRLANIPAEEAQKLFSGNGVKLAYQKPFTAIDDVSSENDTLTETETDTERFNQKARNSGLESLDKEVEIVDLDIDSSPYHIPKKVKSTEGTEKNRSEIRYKSASVKIPVSDLDNIVSSTSDYLNSQPTSHFQNTRTDIDSISFGSSASPRLIPSSDLDRISLKSGNSSQNSPVSSRTSNTNSVKVVSKESNITPVGTPYLHPRQQVPVSEIDDVSVGSSVSTQKTDTRQSQPFEIEEGDFEVDDLYNSGISSGIVGIEFPENHVYIGDNGNLYPEEEYELSDSEKDFRQLSESDDEIETALPPPVEFSDSNYQSDITFDNNQIHNIPVANIDDYTVDSSSVEVSPIHQQIDIISSEQEYPEAELAKLEASLRDLDETSSDRLNSVPNLESVDEDFEILHDSSLPLNYEVTINNERVPYRQELYHTSDIQEGEEFEVAEASDLPLDYEITINNQLVPQKQSSVHHVSHDFHDSNEVLQVVKDLEEDKIVITQFVPVEKNNSSLKFVENNYNNNSTMDTTSEAMLKDALDIEYDMIPDSEKFQTRIILGNGGQSEEAELDDPSFINQNLVAESIAQEMVKAEQNNYGYYMESDDEPDQIPDMDLPENPPDLPDLPPPIMPNLMEKNEYIVTSTPGLTVKLIPSQPLPGKTSSDIEKDSNWSFRVKGLENAEKGSEQEIRPKAIEQESEQRVQFILPKAKTSAPKTDSDLIVPVKVDRKLKLPYNVLLNNERGEIDAPMPEVIIEPKATVTVNSVKPKMPPVVAPKPSPKVAPVVAPKPSPRKVNESKPLGKNIAVIQLTHKDEYDDRNPVDEPIVKPTVVKKDKINSVLTVVRAVNALADENLLGKRNITPKEVGISKKVKSDVENNREHQSPPPKQDTIITDKQMIKKSRQDNVIVTESDKDSEKNEQKETEGGKTNDEKENKSTVTFKTQIKLTKDTVPKQAPHVEEKKMDEIKVNKTSNEPEITKVSVSAVPRMNLDSIGSSESSSLSPKSDKSEDSHEKLIESHQEKTHKTTIGVTKTDSTKKDITPVSGVKQLSQIKPLSFNPKSLSVARPVQYKTTINTLGSRPSGISTLGRSSLLNTQKAEHPIKRMETMPFEVSILKGILGIGIKTKMTPEGLVQITEILPSGPVGREGNIKVGDYLLSINNSELTGLPDSKVQQILRLLPRGLSKIIASAVPPEQSDTSNVSATQEKQKLSPRTSVPLAAARQPAISTTQKSATLPSSRRQVNITSPKQPVVSTSSIPFASHPFATHSSQHERKAESPVTSPKSPKSPKSPISPKSPKSLTPALSPRKHEVTSKSPVARPRTSYVSPRSPDISPRKDDSGNSSPRSPPPVAPKPKRNEHVDELSTDKTSDTHKERIHVVHSPVKDKLDTKEQVSDESDPIETEIFASISGPKSEHIPSQLTGPSILPGSITYDYVSTKDKADSVPGKVDVVESTESQPVTENKHEQEEVSIAPQHEMLVHVNIVQSTNDSVVNTINTGSSDKIFQSEKEHSDQENVIIDNVNDLEQKETDPIANNEYHFRAMEHIDDLVELDELPKQRSQSVSSESSYTEFNECNVEDESNLEEIVEENDTENSAIEFKDNLSKQNMKAYRSMAENIVANVISSVKGMDLSEMHTEKNSESSMEIHEDVGTKNIDYSEFPINVDEKPPPLPDNDAPPLPVSPCPVTETISSNDTSFSYSAPPSQNIVEDLKEISQTSQVHAETPIIVVSSEDTADNVIDIDDNYVVHGETDVYSQEILAPDAEEQGEYTDDFENDSSDNDEHKEATFVQTDRLTDTDNDQTGKTAEADENPDEQSVNVVISMYADIEKSIIHDTDTTQNVKTTANGEIPTIESQRIVGELQMLDNKDLISDETESVETKSLTSSEDVLSEGDIVENHDDNVPVSQTDTETIKTESEKCNTQTTKVNGYSVLISKTDVGRPEDLQIDSNSDKADSSFSSDSARSPPRSGTPHSDDDRGQDRGLHNTDVDRMIRLMGTGDDPHHEGEGEIIEVKMNKGVTGVGFVIQGGKGSPRGDLPITVKRIFRGGPAEQLQVNDELLDVNGEDLTVMKHAEAWQHLKFLPSGEISMTIRRFSS